MRTKALYLAGAALPRAIAHGRVRANAPSTADVLAKVQAGVDRLQGDHETRLSALEAQADADARAGAAGRLGGGGPDGPIDREYSTTFASYLRHEIGTDKLQAANAEGTARGAIQAAMQSGDDAQGGYLAPVEWDRQVRKKQVAKSPMRQLCDVKVTRVGGYSTVWSDGEWGSGWTGETSSRPATSTPGLSSVIYKHGEIYANPGISQQMLDDAAFDLEGWISTEVSDTFDKQEGVAFLSGDGVNKPMGLLQYVTGGAADTDRLRHPGGNLTVVVSGHATTIPDAEVLIDFLYGLPAVYRNGAAWLMSSTTRAALAKLKDTEGRFIMTESLISGQPATLLGYPLVIDENMPSIKAGALAIAFGNFKAGYVINDRGQLRVLRDPYTNKPFVHFYTTKRVGAGLKDPNAIRLMRIAATPAPAPAA